MVREEGDGCGVELGVEGLLLVAGKLKEITVIGRFGFKGFKVGELSG